MSMDMPGLSHFASQHELDHSLNIPTPPIEPIAFESVTLDL